MEKEQILKYLNNQMSNKELREFDQLLAKEENFKLFKEFLITHQYINVSQDQFDDKVAFLLFARKIGIKKGFTISFYPMAIKVLKYAAIFIGLLVLVTKSYRDNETLFSEVTLKMGSNLIKKISIDDETVELRDDKGTVVAIQQKDKLIYTLASTISHNKVATEIKMNTLSIPYGKKFQLILSDGTEVHLNAGSTIKYPTLFAENGIRKVELEGEAYFKVSKNKEKPFVVYTNKIRAEVLGTEFNLSSYRNDPFSELVLVEGSVGIFLDKERLDRENDIILKPNQKVKLTKKDNKLTVSRVRTEPYVSWRNNVLIFNNENFEGIVRKLERRFDVNIKINYDKLKNEHFTGQFDIETLEEIIKTFQKTTPFNYKITNKTININP
ncbi:FecR family protein [Wenyingzhuangia sp. 2_MG-2023]|uniref:FecR family protein n=1 Tax=Wenyingzhuangia sp. 2_MG-2023 TaxID=3062639 RepID=UPI0026E1D55F|nr:FecR family protein [Wenyingzhuangia sp. 2_MG-2023]MDO6736411.1 FecR family protein [Wenyingzhuangia sp. 2_MG-2023]